MRTIKITVKKKDGSIHESLTKLEPGDLVSIEQVGEDDRTHIAFQDNLRLKLVDHILGDVIYEPTEPPKGWDIDETELMRLKEAISSAIDSLYGEIVEFNDSKICEVFEICPTQMIFTIIELCWNDPKLHKHLTIV